MSVVQYAKLCDETIVLTGDAGRAALNEATHRAPTVGLESPGVDHFQAPHHDSPRNVSTVVFDRWLSNWLSVQTADREESFIVVISASEEDEDHTKKWSCAQRSIVEQKSI